MSRQVVIAAPTSTTNMTGFLASVNGFSLMNDSLRARFRIIGSHSGRDRDNLLGRSGVASAEWRSITEVGIRSTPKPENHRGEDLSSIHQEVFDDWAKR